MKNLKLSPIDLFGFLDQDRKKKLEKLYAGWQQRVGPVTTEINVSRSYLIITASWELITQFLKVIYGLGRTMKFTFLLKIM